jgi:acyl-CoA thioester hydrolase
MTEPFRAEQRVLYGDTDSMGVAYYANYLRWFEMYRSLEEQGCYLPVYEAYCRYHNPARYDDIIRIETTFSFAGKARLRFDYVLLHKDNGTVLAEGHTVHVCTDKDGKVLKPPIELKQLLKEMEEKQGSTGNR